MPTVQVLDATGKQAGTLELRPDVFGAEIKTPLLHQAVVRELADRRVGTHDTKGRSEVSGGGKKPWKQKGTGRARQGSIRATQWKGGGKPFGPTPRSYDKALPRQMRREALREAIGASSDPSRVWPGHRLPGRMGGVQRTVLNLTVVRVMPEQNLLLVRGAVPGANGALVMVRKSIKTTKQQQQKTADKK